MYLLSIQNKNITDNYFPALIYCCFNALNTCFLKNIYENNNGPQPLLLVKLYDRNNNIIKIIHSNHNNYNVYLINNSLYQGNTNYPENILSEKIAYMVNYISYLKIIQRKIKKNGFKYYYNKYYGIYLKNILDRELGIKTKLSIRI